MKSLVIILYSTLSQVLSKQWVDPHDMNANSKQYMNLKKSLSTGDLVHESEECNVNIGENNSLIYLKRVINLLLTTANVEKSDMKEHHGDLHISFNDEDFKFLKSFSSMGKVGIDDLRKMDTILSKSLERTYVDTVTDAFLLAQEKVYTLIFSKNCLPLLALSLFLYIAYNLFKSNFSTWYVFRYFVFVVVIIDFIQRYQQLWQEAEEHNMNLEYSLKCDTTKMTWGEYFKFMTSNEDCEKKVVSLLEVGLNQVKSVIIVPLAAAGTGMGQFGSGLWKNLPFPWNILIFPIMLIFCVILTVIVMSTVNNTSFKFNLMHLFHLELGEKKSDITGKTLDKLLDAVNHRPMLQEVKSASGKSPRTKKAAKSVETKKGASPQRKEVRYVSNETQTDNVNVLKNVEETKCPDDNPCEGNST